MINWLSNKIIQHFRNKAISKIDCNSIAVTEKYFSKQIDFLNQKYNNIQELYWIGSYAHDDQLIKYFRENNKLSSQLFKNIPFKISNEDEDIIDIIIGKKTNSDWIISFFSDSLDLYGVLRFMDTFTINADNNFALEEIKNIHAIQLVPPGKS